MPPDLLQIALEHHRGGRLREAEHLYRSVLAQDAGNAEAAHRLGVLLLQAGCATDAILLLQQAATQRPADVAFVHNLGQAYFAAGQIAESIATFEKALRFRPSSVDVMFSMAVAHLGRKMPGDAETALTLLKRAQLEGLGSAELHQNLAVALLMTGRVTEAIAECNLAIGQRADYAEAHYHLGVACLRAGKNEEARQSLQKAVELKPSYARACHGLAGMEAEAGRFASAEELLRRETALVPESRDAHYALGVVLQRMGRWNDATVAFIGAMRASRGEISRAAQDRTASEAIAELEKKITLSAEDVSLRFRLATQTSLAPPPQVPVGNVSGLFDRYADLFDEHLLGTLQYRAPELIATTLMQLDPRTSLDTLDLGCGTGLCGPLLRPMARLLVGVDLSPAMVEKAKERNVYDRLEVGDVLGFLRSGSQVWDLLVAADVLMYFGDLAPIFDAATRALRASGRFAFTVEAGQGDRYQLRRETHRFTHSREYLNRLTVIFGFEQERFDEIVLRKEAGIDVRGLLVVLRLAN